MKEHFKLHYPPEFPWANILDGDRIQRAVKSHVSWKNWTGLDT